MDSFAMTITSINIDRINEVVYGIKKIYNRNYN